MKVGDRLHSRKRIITPTEMDLIPLLTGSWNPVFWSDEASRKAGHGRERRMAPFYYLVPVSIGMAYQTGVFDRAHGYPTGLDKVRFFTPAYERDTLEVDIKALKVASSTGSKSETLLEFTTKKQTGEKVLSFNFIMAYSKRSLKPGRRS